MVKKTTMTKEEFAKRWDSDDTGGGITFEDIVECAIAWGIYDRPMMYSMDTVAKRVVEDSGAKDGY